ncbi:FAD-dependent oxidoreductase [Arthrospiribacter ruber]|uniref:FAD-dependent oxidoreductase n=1 Tax=Arthrospiribacter ruber TaxID=2487934 RepID=A0A951IY48_9BACT|nr:FAD-dependent oxidoreductase [Arthrospiribacter ruber]MBW3468419.1 FAD-dependent oxidoreductase [Arthrospiribacter ruber]
MKRRTFISGIAFGAGAFTVNPISLIGKEDASKKKVLVSENYKVFEADLVVAGGGLGGCAAALAALRNGMSVVMTEETDWIGGQLTQQAVPPDEHQWIETHGATALYREFREQIRIYYKSYYPLTEEARNREFLNPGDGAVSRLCHEPKVALQVLKQLFAPYESSGKIKILLNHKISSAESDGIRVSNLESKCLFTGKSVLLKAPYFVDATELGDLLPLSDTAFVTGTESKSETGELHAPEKGDPENNQAFTMCFAMDYVPGEDWVIPKPEQYDFWNNYIPELSSPWPGTMLGLHYSNPQTLEPKELGFHPEGIPTGDMLNLWLYRRLLHRNNFQQGFYEGDISLVNWPQNDYIPGNLIGVTEKEFNKHIEGGKQLSLSLLYWLQTEAPRPDGGKGWKGLRLRPDIVGTADGMAKYPYVRESRRIKAKFTILEEHVGKEQRSIISGLSVEELRAAEFEDSVGIGYYHIDLHPSSRGDNYIDFPSLPFQIPLGALIPEKMENLIPANKNIGTTHITNGCYRLHPVEWSIGEAVGMLIPFSLTKNVPPAQVYKDKNLLREFQRMVRSQGIETEWPKNA